MDYDHILNHGQRCCGHHLANTVGRSCFWAMIYEYGLLPLPDFVHRGVTLNNVSMCACMQVGQEQRLSFLSARYIFALEVCTPQTFVEVPGVFMTGVFSFRGLQPLMWSRQQGKRILLLVLDRALCSQFWHWEAVNDELVDSFRAGLPYKLIFLPLGCIW